MNWIRQPELHRSLPLRRLCRWRSAVGRPRYRVTRSPIPAACVAANALAECEMVGHPGAAPGLSPIRTARIAVFPMPEKSLHVARDARNHRGTEITEGEGTGASAITEGRPPCASFPSLCPLCLCGSSTPPKEWSHGESHPDLRNAIASSYF